MERCKSPAGAVEELSEGNISGLVEEENRLARDVMQYGIVAVSGDESVYHAIGLMIEKKISGLPVVDGKSVVGMLSEKDVLHLLYKKEFLPGLVRDYMTRNVVCYEIEDRLIDITHCLVENSFRRVPIMYESRLAGVISRADLIRAYQHRFHRDCDEVSCCRRREELSAKDVMKCGILSVKKSHPIHEVADALARWGFTGMPVVNENMSLEGIVTEKDLLNAIDDANVHEALVGDLMTEHVVSFDQDDSLFDICDCLINNNFRRVPILNHGKLTGIISRADLMVYILKNKSAMFRRRRSDGEDV